MPCCICNELITKEDVRTRNKINVMYIFPPAADAPLNVVDNNIKTENKLAHLNCYHQSLGGANLNLIADTCGCGNVFVYENTSYLSPYSQAFYRRCPNCLVRNQERFTCIECRNVSFFIQPFNKLHIETGKIVRQLVIMENYNTDRAVARQFRDSNNYMNCECTNCMTNTTHCRNCQRRIRNELDQSLDDATLCKLCVHVIYPVNNHNYKPKFKMHGRGPRRFGVEVEVHLGDRTSCKHDHKLVADAVMKSVGDKYGADLQSKLYVKHDGSIMPGFELVTMPMDHSKFFDHEYNPLFEVLSNVKKYADPVATGTHNACGIHVHVSRNSISPELLGKLLYLQQDEDYMGYLAQISGRDPVHEYCAPFTLHYEYIRRSTQIADYKQFIDKICKHEQTIGAVTLSALFDAELGREFRWRYASINLETGYTVEFRSFRSSLNANRIKTYVNFVESVLDFCDQAAFDDVNYANYVEWMKINAVKYEHYSQLMFWIGG